MTTISIPLQDIPTDPENPIELTTLPQDEATAYVKKLYSFLPETAGISITDDTVTIDIPEENDYRSDEALRTYKRAVRSAERGKYRPAIRMFADVLKVLPAHIDARRNLAMAYMEIGDGKSAKRHLIEVLRLKPDDAWAFLILGNIAIQFEDDLDSAERFYQRAYELNPNDIYLLNSYGALKGKRGNLDEARAFFQQAIEIDTDYPNPRHSLALSYMKEGQMDQALNILEELFEKPRSQDPRSEPVYEQARALYLDVNRRIALESQTQMVERLEEAMEDHATQTGYSVSLERDDSIAFTAVTKLAWVYGQKRHVIKYRSTEPAILPHLIAHEFEHIKLAYDVRQAGRSKVFVFSPDSLKENVQRDSSRSQRELRRRGLSDQAIADFVDRLTSGLAHQLSNIPVDMIVEYRLYHKYDFIRPSQVVSLHATQLENLQALTDKSIQATAPPYIYRANITMNCAYALFTDFLLNGATAYADPYRKSRVFSTGRKLFRIWQDFIPHFTPGNEYDLVDEFARVLNLQEWYEWQPDDGNGRPPDISALPGMDGPTNVELLKQKEPAAVMYLRGALERFEDMDDEEVFQIASEIALLGRFGLDYASPEQKYKLDALPGEKFSGLQLMCLMYAGFRRVQPSWDMGLPLEDAYSMALAMHKSK